MSPDPGAAVGVMIVDDQAPFRRAARMVMAATPGFDVVGEAETGEEAVELFERLQPGLVLMDINLGRGINGIEATRRITAAHPDATVILLSTYQAADLPERRRLLRRGRLRQQGGVRPRHGDRPLEEARRRRHRVAKANRRELAVSETAVMSRVFPHGCCGSSLTVCGGRPGRL